MVVAASSVQIVQEKAGERKKEKRRSHTGKNRMLSLSVYSYLTSFVFTKFNRCAI